MLMGVFTLSLGCVAPVWAPTPPIRLALKTIFLCDYLLPSPALSETAPSASLGVLLSSLTA